MLIDAAAYFGAVRSAMLKARSRIFILGWDIHSRTPLVGESGKADDGYPEAFGDFLSALVSERRQLKVYVLLWDFAVLYAAERELFPTYALRWTTPRGVQFALDDAVPIGSSQHQKVIVIDDKVAFSGGLDVTIRRWDTSAHDIDQAFRKDPQGKPYAPFHDVQAVVDSDAARALGRLARARWDCACGERVPLRQAKGHVHDVWPDSVTPDFKDVMVGIARTQPLYDTQKEVREVERLFLESIARAERSIYIENQFLSSMVVAKALAARLRARPELELLIVAPGTHESWLEARSMRNGRIRFANELAADDIKDRVRIMYPDVKQHGRNTHTMVHSKIMIVDDHILRIGSANLNNRSMGTDTECDLVIEAHNKAERAAVLAVRDRLLADHTGCAVEKVAAVFAENPSLINAADTLHGRGHRLRLVDDGPPDSSELSTYIEGVADPEHPILADQYVAEWFGSGA
ncbi:MAG: phospholipase, partial [Pseudolabrys sp.]|nr:phospholipase [Pseudolabrys sp.]